MNDAVSGASPRRAVRSGSEMQAGDASGETDQSFGGVDSMTRHEPATEWYRTANTAVEDGGGR